MTQSKDCLSRQQLQDYLAGKLDDETCRIVEQHLVTCSACEETITDLDGSSDTLMRTLKLRETSPSPAPDWVEKLADGQSVDGAEGNLEVKPMSQLGDYELRRVLGRGGMSIVFEATHQHLGREVALKVLVPGAQYQRVSRERFAREMRAVGQLDHPTIVRATDAGQWQGTLYLVMEKIDGLDLTTISRRTGPMEIANACKIIALAARGLAHAHSAEIVHRDIKPSNVMIDRQGNVKILDFGLARSSRVTGDVSMQTTVGQLLGTLDYMAPEQSNRSDVDTSADIYALGATLFKLVAGVPPHGRSSESPVLEHLNRLANSEAPSLSEYRDDLPQDLVELVAAMLRRDTDRRLVDLSAIVARLDRLSEGADLPGLVQQALQATPATSDDDAHRQVEQSMAEIWPLPSVDQPPPPIAPARGPKRSRGRRAVFAVAAAAVLLLVVGWILQSASSQARLSIIGIPPDRNVSVKSRSGSETIVLSSESPRAEIKLRPGEYTVLAEGMGTQSVRVESGEKAIIRLATDEAAAATEAQKAVPSPLPVPSVPHLRNANEPSRVVPTERTNPTGGTQPGANGSVPPADVSKIPEAVEPAQPPQLEPQPPAPNPEASSNAAIQQRAIDAKLRLNELQRSLSDQHPSVIKAKEEVAALEAVFQATPTEPVFEGRTLKHWQAQMRFEQEPKAKTRAASRVLILSKTLDNEAAFAAAAEAAVHYYRESGKDLATLSRSVEDSVVTFPRTDELKSLRSAAARTSGDHGAEVLIQLLQSDNPVLRRSTLFVVGVINDEIHEDFGSWTPLVQHIAGMAKDGDDPLAYITRSLGALLCDDIDYAADHLSNLPVDGADASTLRTWFWITDKRELPVDQNTKTLWFTRYLMRAGEDLEQQFYFESPRTGPLLGIDWASVTASQQQVLRQCALALQKRLESLLAEPPAPVDPEFPTSDNSTDREAAIASRNLCRIVRRVRFDEQLDAEIAQTLTGRLERLIPMRTQQAKPIDDPSMVAEAIVLLTGQAPSILLETPLEKDFSLKLQNAPWFYRGAVSSEASAVKWYPYESMKQLYSMHFRSMQRRGPAVETKHGDGISKPLLLHYATVSNPDRGARYSVTTALFGRKQLHSWAKSHPAFRGLLQRYVEQPKVKFYARPVVEALEAAMPTEAFVDLLLQWTRDHRSELADLAVQTLHQLDPDRFKNQWAERIGKAIGQVNISVKSDDGFSPPENNLVYYLSMIGEHAAPSVPSLLEYVLDSLDQDEDYPVRSSMAMRPLAGQSEIGFCTNAYVLKVLAHFPESVEEIAPDLEEMLEQANPPFLKEDMQKLLLNEPPPSSPE